MERRRSKLSETASLVVRSWIMKNNKPTIRDLYPNVTEEELAEAERNVDQYLKVALEIFEQSGDRLSEIKKHLTK